MKPETLVKLDFITALVFTALGVGVFEESLRMPRLENLDINPYTAPGLVPGILGIILAALGILLLVRSCLQGGWRISGARFGVRAFFRDKGIQRLALALLLTFGYAGGLLGRLPFWLATFLFVAAFIIAFEWLGSMLSWRRAVTGLIEAALVAGAVTFVFQEVFLVRLP